jgi:hypothetical protein
MCVVNVIEGGGGADGLRGGEVCFSVVYYMRFFVNFVLEGHEDRHCELLRQKII